MKKYSSVVFNIIAVFLILMFVIFAVCPFNLIDMEQAQRIAKWKAEYKQLKYCFSLVDMFEGSMTTDINPHSDIAENYFIAKTSEYFNITDDKLKPNKEYNYRKKNGRFVHKDSQFYFDKFVKTKDDILLSLKRNISYNGSANQPIFYMFVDINGEEKPNRIGHDIFFIDVFEHKIDALGHDKDYIKLKQNCSPIGSGLYCSEFYLLGGHF